MQKNEKEVYAVDLEEMPPFKRGIGRTVYEVTLHFSSTSKENPYDKLKRIILNDCDNLKKMLLFTADFDNQAMFYVAHPVGYAINLHKT